MYTLFIVVLIACLTYIGIRSSWKNVERGLGNVVKFRLRYTLFILLVLGYTTYVDNLEGEEQREMIALTTDYVLSSLDQLDAIFVDAFDWISEAINT